MNHELATAPPAPLHTRPDRPTEPAQVRDLMGRLPLLTVIQHARGCKVKEGEGVLNLIKHLL